MIIPRIIQPPRLDGAPRPFWSVMIPTYQPRADYLRQTIESVLQQDAGAGEMQIEVVDDASPEITEINVAALVKTIAGDRVAFSSTKKNLGLAGCWNTCIEHARGEWVHLLHQDDCVRPGFYERLRHLIRTQPQAGAAFCGYDYINTNSERIFETIPLQTVAGSIPQPAETLAVKNQVQCPAIVVRRAAYETVGGFDDQFSFTLDWEMWLRIAASFSVLYQPEVLASFRIQSDSETSRLAQTGETVWDSMRMIANYPKYISSARATAVQAQAREWVCDLALQKASVFIAHNQVGYAMAQLHAGLSYDRRMTAWRSAFILWAKAIKKSRRWLLPPLPILPTAWFQGYGYRPDSQSAKKL
ncbi:MAG: glycosyltransferase [Verrucomicrobiae bacterium]